MLCGNLDEVCNPWELVALCLDRVCLGNECSGMISEPWVDGGVGTRHQQGLGERSRYNY